MFKNTPATEPEAKEAKIEKTVSVEHKQTINGMYMSVTFENGHLKSVAVLTGRRPGNYGHLTLEGGGFIDLSQLIEWSRELIAKELGKVDETPPESDL